MTATVLAPVLESTNRPAHGPDALFGASRSELLMQVCRSRGDLVKGKAYIDRVGVYHANGRRDVYRVQDWVDLVQGLRVVIDGAPGDIVGLDLSWASPIVVEGAGEVGAFEVEAKPRRTRMRIRAGEGKQSLSPWRVSSGRALGGGPRLVVALEPVQDDEFEIEPPSRHHGGGEHVIERPRPLEVVVLTEA